ncbi:hypothetical protein Pan97_27590 [Bremerella volcania]|uniref:Uncharacterized protein n=1 Tax=Bremerella volcania TaxID=2527984 RepID=A0A518C913_9BACT|nr:hypothetical protein Pan97_27590 [Bremerella volcania]
MSPHNSLRGIRQAIHTDKKWTNGGEESAVSPNQFDADFAELVLAKLESLLSLQRELVGNEVLAAASALNYLGSTLVQQSLMEKDELNWFAAR